MDRTEFSPVFARAVLGIAADLRAACSAGLVWKDACPDWLGRTPPSIGEHLHPWCVAVKADLQRRERCCRADNLLPGAVSRPQCRTCPFGVIEVAVPVLAGGMPAGLAWIGSWRADRAAPLPDLAAEWLLLPVFPGRRAALAMARMAHARLAEAVTGRRRRVAELASRAGDEAMARAADWIAANPVAGLRARAAAAHVQLSVSRFLHRFRSITGTTFAAYRDACVMERARRELADSSRRVIEVALALGYSSHSRFCEAFRRHQGMTPSAWRQRRAMAGA